jgi:biotin transport system substrate-specific component
MSDSNKFNFTAFLFVLFGVALISILAQCKLDIPFLSSDIPGTWQTFAVLVFAYCTNRWLSFLAVFIYLVLGYFGFPVFAEGSSGEAVLFGKTGGYLFGFLIGAFVIGWLGEKGWSSNFAKSLLAMTIGTAIILAIGVFYLANFIGWSDAVKYGFTPFLIGAAIKIIAGTAVCWFYEQSIKKLIFN